MNAVEFIRMAAEQWAPGAASVDDVAAALIMGLMVGVRSPRRGRALLEELGRYGMNQAADERTVLTFEQAFDLALAPEAATTGS